MTYLYMVLTIAGIIASFIFNIVAQRERSSGPRPSHPLMPSYGNRRDFTSRGWTYRNLTIAAQMGALAALLLWWWTGF